MLPVVRGTSETTRQILLYSLGGRVHAGGRSRPARCTPPPPRAGLAFLWLALQLAAMRAAGELALFHYSLAYLALLFVAAALDPVVL